MKRKSEAKDIIKRHIRYTNNETKNKLFIFRSDGGKEYINKDLQLYFDNNGVHVESSNAYCAPQNGLAEAYNKNIVNRSTAVLSRASLSSKWWGDAVLGVNCVNQLCYHRKLGETAKNKLINMTPLGKWQQSIPDISKLQPMFCRAYVYIDKTHRKKEMKPKAKR